ncbi:MAG: FAD binding domain-containing protein [Deltaproteobacteria bacterium]|nr:FAD binding domain-containing protein [Deltaproteobacteria bacterium]
MKPFEYIAVGSIAEAVDLLVKNRGKARLIAGGTDILPLLKRDCLKVYPEMLINIKNIPDLQYIKEENGNLKIGALTKLDDIAKSPLVKEKYGLLKEAALSVASPQIRNMGTIGGNLCQDVRCWYYRYPHQIGGKLICYLKGGKTCYALTGDNRYHSVFECYKEGNRPSACAASCPAGVNIPSYLKSLREGNPDEAARILFENNPLSAITGRVCPHYCEKECTRNYLDESVAIRDIERFFGDYALDKADILFKDELINNGKSVAVVGSGPAGLSAGYYLRRLGYAVTIFERDPVAGGLLHYAIPSFRLPKKVVDNLVSVFKRVFKVDFKMNTEIGRDISIYDLMQRFDAVFVATGAYKDAKMDIPGEELLINGLDFLKKINSGVKDLPGIKTAVIGGGNSAIDVARVLLRLGAKPRILYRRTEKEMPALEEEIKLAKEEGIEFDFLTLPIGVEKKGEKLILKCVRMELGPKDETGRPKPIPIKGSEFTVEYDAVIKAIGETPDSSFIPGEFLDDRGKIKVDMSTGFVGKNLFAGGDFVSGPATVIEAVVAGRKAAFAIDRLLSGKDLKSEEKKKEHLWDKVNVAYLKPTKRVTIPKRGKDQRVLDLEDVLNLSFEDVKFEAMRCINCGCVAVNPSDMAVALMALGAQVKIQGPEGEKIISVEDLFESPRGPVGDSVVLTEIIIPQMSNNKRQTFLKFRLRDSIDFAIASVALVLEISDNVCWDSRIVLGSISPRPIRAFSSEEVIKGKVINEDIAEAAAQAAVSHLVALSMNEYKVKIIKSLVKKALLSTSGL